MEEVFKLRIKIYDYEDEIVEVEIPVQSIEEIVLVHVRIISGDEVGCIKLKSGKVINFDACKTRIFNSYDGDYVLHTFEQIKNWVAPRIVA